MSKSVSTTALPLARAFLVGTYCLDTHDPADSAELLEELCHLADTLGLVVCDRILVRIRTPNSRFLVGSGKAAEIAELARAAQADMIVFDDPLSPSQQRNWERLMEMPVVDRHEIILDIFAKHARTREAVLQGSLAKARYDLPRLKRRWSHFSRQRGMRGGMMGRGEGEQQIEIDYRQVRSRIAQLKEELEEVEKARTVQRRLRQRRAVSVAALVGYTNAGKSRVFNRLTQAGVLVENQLFATLDSTVRRLRLPDRQELLLTDPVGFIRKLPHLLVEAFKSTLEEVLEADFLLEILDAANPQVEEHHTATAAVLKEIGAERHPTITVFNKIDLVADPLVIQRLRRKHPDAIFVSAKDGSGIERLLTRLAEQIRHLRHTIRLLVPHSRYDILSRIHAQGQVIHQEFNEDGILVEAAVPFSLVSLLRPFEQTQAPLNPLNMDNGRGRNES